MNERIKELERQATETVKCGLNGTSTAESFNRKKFAELLIRECMKVTVNYPHPQTKLTAAEHIARHFGVE